MTADGPETDPDGAFLARLERIDALDRRGASPAELLPELRGLLSDADRWLRDTGIGEEVVSRLRTAPHRT